MVPSILPRLVRGIPIDLFNGPRQGEGLPRGARPCSREYYRVVSLPTPDSYQVHAFLGARMSPTCRIGLP
jgi:hypothetical protein